MRDLKYGNLSEDESELASVAERVFEDERDSASAGAELGFFGVGIPGDAGGSDGAATDLAVLIESVGAARAASSLADVAMVCAPLLLSDADPADERWRALLAGELLPTLPVLSPWRTSRSLSVEDRRATGTLTCLGGDPVGLVVLPCVVDGVETIAFLGADQDGVQVDRVPGTDTARATWKVTATGADLEAAWRTISGDGVFAQYMARRSAVAALDAVGAARSALAITLEYADVREQFGQPIGSFQAYQHRCADAFSRLTLAQSLAFNAVRDAEPFQVLASLAAGRLATASAAHVCGEAVQLHGAIGFTWEGGIHHYVKRSRLDEIIGLGCGTTRDLFMELDREANLIHRGEPALVES